VYRLTKKGVKRLEVGRAEWHHFVQIVGTILGAPA